MAIIDANYLPELAERLTNRHMTISNVSPIELHADPEHSGVRTAVSLTLIVLLILSYIVVKQLLQSITGDSPLTLVCGIALPISLAIAWGIEAILKRVWHSGRSLQIRDNKIIASNRVQPDVQFNLDQELDHIQWQFKMGDYPRGGRERRIAGAWFCLAVQLQQGTKRLTAFSYMPAKKMSAVSALFQFNHLDMEEVYNTSMRSRIFSAPTRPDISAKVLSGGNGRYWLAEKTRWQDGYELTPSDLEIFLQILQKEN